MTDKKAQLTVEGLSSLLSCPFTPAPWAQM